MADRAEAGDRLAGAFVDDAFALRPDYRTLLLAVDGLLPGPSDEHSDALLLRAETAASKYLVNTSVEQLPHVGSPRLVRATGAEPFDTVAAGVVEHHRRRPTHRARRPPPRTPQEHP